MEKLRVHAVPLLLGCSSGQLTRHGRSLDPLGTAQVGVQNNFDFLWLIFINRLYFGETTFSSSWQYSELPPGFQSRTPRLSMGSHWCGCRPVDRCLPSGIWTLDKTLSPALENMLTIDNQHWLGGKKDGQPELLQVSENSTLRRRMFILKFYLWVISNTF